MRGRLTVLALLALALPGCGSGSNASNSSAGSPAGQREVAVPSTTVPARTDAAKPSDAEQQVAAATARRPVRTTTTFVRSRKRGKAPAVVFVHDLAGAGGEALGEARRLAKRGVASLVLTGAHAPSTDPAQFRAALAKVEAAIRKLRRHAGVDPGRIALVGEGNGARLAAVILGRHRGELRGAVLADLGVAGGGAGQFEPARWLSRARGSLVMLQRSTAQDRTSDEQIKELLVAAPPGTLVYDYEKLDRAAQAARDRWLRKVLA